MVKVKSLWLSGRGIAKVVAILIGGLLLVKLFSPTETKRPEGLIQILPYTLNEIFEGEIDEDKEWPVEFVLPVELQDGGQVVCEDFVGSKQYLALRTVEPHSENGMTRFAPVWIRKDLDARSHYRCDLNVNGTNIPWQVPQEELDEINFRNRNRMAP